MKKNFFWLAVILFFSSLTTFAQRPGTTSMTIKTDTLDLDAVVANFRASQKANGTYDLYSYTDGTKIQALVKNGRIMRLFAFDNNKAPIPPTAMKKKTPIKCWLAVSNSTGRHLLQVACDKGLEDLF